MAVIFINIFLLYGLFDFKNTGQFAAKITKPYSFGKKLPEKRQKIDAFAPFKKVLR